MSLVAPAALGLAALVPALILFYLLKVRRQEVDVSSTFLWEQLHRDLVAHEPWQRLKTSLLLLIQLLLMLLLVFGIARPFFTIQAQASDNVVILLDASASMQATDVAPNRFQAAKAAARQIVDRLSDDATGTIIRVMDHPQILVQGAATKTQMYDALNQVTVSSATTNMKEALQLALSLNKGKTRSQIFIISDGAFPAVDQIGAVDADIHFIPIGTSGANQGIVTFAARPDPAQAGRQQVFVRVQNFGAQPATNLLSLYADGKLVGSAGIQMPARGTAEQIFNSLPADTKVAEARLRDGDALMADNAAWLVLHQISAVKVLLVTANNLFVEKAVNLLPSVEVFKVAPNAYGGIDPSQYNVFIFDGFLPQTLPTGNMFILNPPPTDWLPMDPNPVLLPKVTSYDQQDPLLNYVQFNNLELQKAKGVIAPPWAKVLAESDSHPLLLAGDNGGRKMVILPFDLHASNLGLLSDFPIFISNVMSYLQPSDPTEIKAPSAGDTVLLQPLPQADRIVVTKPDGAVRSFTPNGKPIAFADTDNSGLYRVSQEAKGKAIEEQSFAINLTDQAESDIGPHTSITIGNALVRQNSAVDWTPARREFWPWVLLAAIGILTFEWYWYHRHA